MTPRALPALAGLAVIAALLAAGCAGTAPPPSPPGTTPAEAVPTATVTGTTAISATTSVATTATPAVPTSAVTSPRATRTAEPTDGAGDAPSTEPTTVRTTCSTVATPTTRTSTVTPGQTSTATLTPTATAPRTTAATATVTPTSTPPGAGPFTEPELRYLLLDHYGEDRFFYCDPDQYPVARGDELERALEAFPALENDTAEFAAITGRLGLAPPHSDEEKLAIYREHKKLQAISLAPGTAGSYTYALALGTETDGRRVSGTVLADGTIREGRSEPAVLTCPICLPAGTRIETPAGPVPVEEVREGMPVWTLDATGARVAAPVVRTSRTSPPPGHAVVRIGLSDGRAVAASPGHPTVDGRTVNRLRPGEALDGAVVTSVRRVPYGGDCVYDLLPAGPTGGYWADGVPLGSTLG